MAAYRRVYDFTGQSSTTRYTHFLFSPVTISCYFSSIVKLCFVNYCLFAPGKSLKCVCCCLSATSDLFALGRRTGVLAVNHSLYGMSNRTFTLDVRASYESYYATELLDGCSCANRSDVYVNVLVEQEKKQVVVFESTEFTVCE